MTPGLHREMVEMNDLISVTGRGQDEHVSLEYLVVTGTMGIIKDEKGCFKETWGSSWRISHLAKIGQLEHQ